MADVQEAVRRLTIEATARGVSETTALLHRMVGAQNEVTVASEKSEKSTQTMERRLESIQKRYDEEYRKQRELLKLEKDLDTARSQGLLTSKRQSELIALAATQMGAGAAGNGLYAKSLALAEAQAQAFASRLGPIGGLMAGLSPATLAAGAALGVVTVALYKAHEAANAFAADMLKLRDVSQTIGLSSTQFQAIADEGAKFALSEDRIGQVLQRFTAQMEEFRRGQGDLFALVQRIDPALAREMAAARDTATAIDTLARVYEKAGDARQKLDRAIGGRNGGTVGLLFQEVGKQGGVDAVTAEFEKSGDAIDKHMIEKVARLKAEIDDMAGDARRNFQSIFSTEVLEAEYKFYETWREISRAAKDFSLSSDWDKFIDGLNKALRLSAIKMGLMSERGFGAQSVDETGMQLPPDTPLPQSRPGQVIDRSTMELELNLEKARIGALGSAATATERLTQRKRELALAVHDNVITQGEYNRALGAAGLETAIQLAGRRIALLGEAASVDEVVIQKQREINLARAQGVRITREESAAILERTKLQTEYSRLPNKLQFERDQIGRSDIDATVAGRLRSEGLPIDMDSATASEMRFNEQLRQTKDLLVETGTGAMRSFRSELEQGANAWDALGKAGLKALDNILMKLADKTLDRAVTGLLNGVGATGKTGATGGLLGGFIIPGILHEGGLGMNAPSSGRYMHPAYFENAPRFHGGKTPWGPGEMPAIIRPEEEVLTTRDPRHAWNGGGSARGGDTFNFTDNRTFNDVTPNVMAQLEVRLKQERPHIVAEAMKAMKKQRGSDPNAYAP